jgi:hypothetical protein
MQYYELDRRQLEVLSVILTCRKFRSEGMAQWSWGMQRLCVSISMRRLSVSLSSSWSEGMQRLSCRRCQYLYVCTSKASTCELGQQVYLLATLPPALSSRALSLETRTLDCRAAQPCPRLLLLLRLYLRRRRTLLGLCPPPPASMLPPLLCLLPLPDKRFHV